jgi:hypothetical protein
MKKKTVHAATMHLNASLEILPNANASGYFSARQKNGRSKKNMRIACAGHALKK